jgi:hypothetical protein
MDTSKPAWAVVGQIVNVNGKHWTGRIVDVAVSTNGVVLLRIDSPKADFLCHPPEWLEYKEGAIAPGSMYDMKACVKRYADLNSERAPKIARWAIDSEEQAGFEWPDEKV